MEIDDEVIAVGDLLKKTNSGFKKSWNLRRFTLRNVFLTYYKVGDKRGEFDISGCTVRKITSEECGNPAAKFAFIIDGIRYFYFVYIHIFYIF